MSEDTHETATAGDPASPGTDHAAETPSASRPDDAPRTSMRTWITVIVLTISVIGSMVHQAGPQFKWNGWELESVNWRLWEWFIEDAAISFAYARNWAAGDGLVAFPGSERIEGYSNPLWVALMAFFYLFDVDGFVSSKWMAMVFGSITVLFTWRIAVETIDDEESWAPLIAPLILAACPPAAFWNAAGLENSLFNMTLAGGMWRTLVEAKRGGFPWSAVFFLLLAVTRPEAIMYGAWGGFLGMVLSLTAGRGLWPTARWLLVFFVPFVGYHALRYDYFAWAFPNTYYAKLGHRPFKPFGWAARGWKYIRGFGADTGTGWFMPLFFTGLVGLRGARAWIVPVASLLAAVFFLYPDAEITQDWEWWPKDMWAPDQDFWWEFRVWGLLAMALLMPVATLGHKQAPGRVMSWGMALLTLFFCIRSTGDWMNGYRWMSMLAVPMAVLFATGAEELADFAERVFARGGRTVRGWGTAGWLVATTITLAVLPGWYQHSEAFFAKRETGPFSVKRRAEHSDWVMERLFVWDQHIYNLDVDMGAHLYWSSHEMVDMAGLVDLTISHHNYGQRAVTQEYVFGERNPPWAHVHGGWARTSRIPTYPEWKQGYVELPGFPVSKRTNHMGNFVRRDLILVEDYDGPSGRRAPFEEGIWLAGFEVPSPEISVGKALYLEYALQYREASDREDIRVTAFLSDDQGHIHSFDVPTGYDWVPPSEWRVDETFVGKFAANTEREGLPPGLYDLGFVVFGGDGRVIPVKTETADGAPTRIPRRAVVGGVGDEPARFAVGEIRFPGIVRIGPPGTGERAAKADFDRAVQAAQEGRCEDAERSWSLARRHIPRAEQWHETHRAELADFMSDCWVGQAAAETDPHAAVPHMKRAKFWNHRNPNFWEQAAVTGDRLFQEGMGHKAAEDWTAAFEAFLHAVEVNPTLAWARRYAEEARDHRLGIDPESEAEKEKARQERLARIEEERKAREAERGADGEDGDDE